MVVSPQRLTRWPSYVRDRHAAITYTTPRDAPDATGGEVLAVTVVGEPKVVVGQPVSVTGLVALPWSQDGRSGIAYRAEAITATDPATVKTGQQAR
ncbi:hypothetical protein MAHJHV63_40110 [Mycobacterium avium subsp. hominissuis]